jgi:TM2 domain-containing membrane protein YozV
MQSYFRCPACAGEVINDYRFAGHFVSCPYCHNQIQIPMPPPVQQQWNAQLGPPIPPPVYQSSSYQNQSGPEKNSGISAVLSFICPGVGQIFNGQIGKGILFILFGAVFAVMSVFLIGLPFLLVLWAWGIYDAYNEAERINQQSRFRR